MDTTTAMAAKISARCKPKLYFFEGWDLEEIHIAANPMPKLERSASKWAASPKMAKLPETIPPTPLTRSVQ